MVPDERTGGPRFAAFCERFVRHTKGHWSVQPFVLEPWQREFWWEALEVDPATGLRVYTEVGLGLPRKNGKSGTLRPRPTTSSPPTARPNPRSTSPRLPVARPASSSASATVARSWADTVQRMRRGTSASSIRETRGGRGAAVAGAALGHAPSTVNPIARAASAWRRSKVSITSGWGRRSAAARCRASSVRTSYRQPSSAARARQAQSIGTT